ncbi:MAG: helix-turn-helix domain-containing protein [Deltaproteobacteria bacterium]|nr:helix-turn-helix domain-containing protein [Deltaproteobacteria bacterium]
MLEATSKGVTSGVEQLDQLLDGLYIGDNVVWHDDAGSLAAVFCLHFIRASQAEGKPLIYVTFDRSPRNLLEKLGPLADSPLLIILDCFTYGKGAGSSTFLKFYETRPTGTPGRIVQVDEPREMTRVTEALYGIHAGLEGDVRFVFESLTGMQELWGGEEQVLNFYSHSCPRLYELNTIAYWVMEKKAHSTRLRAQINQIAQVAIDLSIKRGTTSLTILKAEKRKLDNLQRPYKYWVKESGVTLEGEGRTSGLLDLGQRIKELRSQRGLSQTELAQRVGVTPSTISQVESNLIFPSLPALFKMAEVLAVDGSTFFKTPGEEKKKVVFPAGEALPIKVPGLTETAFQAKRLTPLDLEAKVEPFLVEILPQQTLPGHFFLHKGAEWGYLLSGKLQLRLPGGEAELREGDSIYLTLELPGEWSNPGPEPARLLWLKIK